MPCVHHVHYNDSKWQSDTGAAEAGLNTAKILRKVTETAVGVWDLDKSVKKKGNNTKSGVRTEIEPPRNILTRLYRPDFSESVSGKDNRTRVDPKHFAPKGKYRAIVKLFVKFQGNEDDEWAIGTGWLIAPNMIVTAGHCAFDWAYNLGHAKSIKAYIGYSGQTSVGNPGVEFRWGKHVAVPAEWLKNPTENYDMALIRVESDFKDVTPMNFRNTPVRTVQGKQATLGVVGYPADRTEGEYMYEHFRKESFDILRTKRMLTYKIDTAGGNSGSPVLVQNGGYSVGIHAYGGAVNKASVLGPNGNILEDYLRAMQIKETGKDSESGVVPSKSTDAETSVKGFQFITVPSIRDDERGVPEMVHGKRKLSELLNITLQEVDNVLQSLTNDEQNAMLGRLYLGPNLVDRLVTVMGLSRAQAQQYTQSLGPSQKLWLINALDDPLQRLALGGMVQIVTRNAAAESSGAQFFTPPSNDDDDSNSQMFPAPRETLEKIYAEAFEITVEEARKRISEMSREDRAKVRETIHVWLGFAQLQPEMGVKDDKKWKIPNERQIQYHLVQAFSDAMDIPYQDAKERVFWMTAKERDALRQDLRFWNMERRKKYESGRARVFTPPTDDGDDWMSDWRLRRTRNSQKSQLKKKVSFDRDALIRALTKLLRDKEEVEDVEDGEEEEEIFDQEEAGDDEDALEGSEDNDNW